jgi:hypothetical protein
MILLFFISCFNLSQNSAENQAPLFLKEEIISIQCKKSLIFDYDECTITTKKDVKILYCPNSIFSETSLCREEY